MRLWGRTLRFQVADDELRMLTDTGKPTILVFWHNRLFIAAEGYRRFRAPRPTYCLISASRDGAWLAAFMSLNGMHAVRGSSSRRGREALRELEARLREGNDAGITPDGPRGPAYSFKSGAPMLATRTGTRVLLLNAVFSSAWRMRSWDGFYLPRPFSSVTVRAAIVEPEEMEEDLAVRTRMWKERLLTMGEEIAEPSSG